MNAIKTGKRLGPWAVEKELGAGAMGAVYRCHDLQDPTRIAAVKLVATAFLGDETMLARFEREARALARIDSPHCCGTLGSGVEGKQPWIALEFIEGAALDEVLERRRRFEVEEALELAVGMLRGLEAAHVVGVVHRDVKPANMILRPSGELVLVDFGMARRDDESMVLTTEGSILGTPHYMSPEQADGKTPDARGDLYAVGAVLFHLISGRPPFLGRTAMQIVRAHLESPVPELGSMRPGVPDGVAHVVRRLLAKAPQDRYANATLARRTVEAQLRRLRTPEPPPQSEAPAPPAAIAVSAPRATPEWLEGGQTLPLVVGAALTLSALGALLGGPGLAVVLLIATGIAGGLIIPPRASRGSPPSVDRQAHLTRARALASAGDHVGAARAFAANGMHLEAARAFEAGDDLVAAAQAFERVEMLADAARLFEAAGKLPEAIELLKQLEDFVRAADLLERLERRGEAATLLAGYLAELETRRKQERFLTRVAALDQEIANVSQRATHLLSVVGREREAAVILARMGEHLRAGELFLRVGDRDAAAHAFLSGGQRARAIEVHQRAGDVISVARLRAEEHALEERWDDAIAELVRVSDLDFAATMSERAGRPERAAELRACAAHPTEPTPPAAAKTVVLSDPAITDAAETLVGGSLLGQVVGRYAVRSLLGQGAFAQVYLAEHTLLDRRVALKVLNREVAVQAQVSQRFLAEARLVAKLNHPGVVQLYDFGPVGDTFFMALQLVEGQSLRERLRGGPLSLHESVRIVIEAARAVQSAHDQGVVHQDLKPENVMLEEDDGGVRVVDFGMAQVFWDTQLEPGSTLFQGTARYASPEGARGDSVDVRADQYALGLLLFELASGVLPFESDSPVGWLQQHANAAPALLRERVPQAPFALERIVSQALAKRPEERFASCAEFADALEALDLSS